MTILVTGGTGLVGSRLLPRLVEAGLNCRALVRPGKTVPSGVTVVEGDILDPASLVEAVRGRYGDHPSCCHSSHTECEKIWRANVDGTRNLIAAAGTHAADARFIMASTGLVYRENSSWPSRESDPVAPERDYPASKIAAEKLLQESGLNWSIVRPGFVYGDADGHLGQIPHIAQIMRLHPANRLSMIHHRDIATFIKMGLNGILDGRIVNAVDDGPMTIFELTALAGQPMAPAATPLTDPWYGVLDGSLALSRGFRPIMATAWQAARENAV